MSANDLANSDAIRGYLDHLRRTGIGSRSAARHLTTLRNFYTFLLREGRIATDPTEHLRTPKQWQNIPNFLNLEQIEKIVRMPDTAKPTGLRDRAMLELLYATGLRVSELCKVGLLELDLQYGLVRATGKGNKTRIVPVGKTALKAVDEYLRNGRPALLKGRGSPFLFVTARGGSMTGRHSGRCWGRAHGRPATSTV